MHGASKKQRLSAVVLCWGQCLDDWLKRIASRLEAIASRLEAIAGGLKGIAKQAVILQTHQSPKQILMFAVCSGQGPWMVASLGSSWAAHAGEPREGEVRQGKSK